VLFANKKANSDAIGACA